MSIPRANSHRGRAVGCQCAKTNGISRDSASRTPLNNTRIRDKRKADPFEAANWHPGSDRRGQRKAANGKSGRGTREGSKKQRKAAEQERSMKAADRSGKRQQAKAAKGSEGNKSGGEKRLKAAEGSTEGGRRPEEDEVFLLNIKVQEFQFVFTHELILARRHRFGPAEHQPRHLYNGGPAQTGPLHQRQARRHRRATATLPGAGPEKPSNRREPGRRQISHESNGNKVAKRRRLP